MDLSTRSEWNGMLDLAMLSRVYGTLVTCRPTYSSRSSVTTDLDKLGKLKSYLDYIHLPGLSSLPFLVAVMLNLAPNNHLRKLDHMGSFRYLPRLDQQVLMDTYRLS